MSSLLILSMDVNRDSLLKDAYKGIMGSSAKKLRNRRLNISWNKEEGLDYGGPQREFFFKLSRLLFNPYYGLFEYSTDGGYVVQISRHSSQIDNAHQWLVVSTVISKVTNTTSTVTYC